MGGGVYLPGLNFYRGPLNEEGCILGTDEVKFFTNVGNKVIPLSEFKLLVVQFAEKAIGAARIFELNDKGIVSAEWLSLIQEWIEANKEQYLLTSRL